MSYTISDRSQYAGLILDLAYSWRSGDDIKCQATDIVADIMHLCDDQGIAFSEVLRMSAVHHHAELAEATVEDVNDKTMIRPSH